MHAIRTRENKTWKQRRNIFLAWFLTETIENKIWFQVIMGSDTKRCKIWVQEDLLYKSDLLFKYGPVHKKVPVLVHCEKPISESPVILECIEEIWPHNPLLPLGPSRETLMRYDRTIVLYLIIWESFGYC